MNDTTHPVAPEEVMSFLDGELSADRSQSVSAHIEECFDCHQLRDSLRNTSRSFSRWVVPASPVDAGVKDLLSSSAFVASLKRPSPLGISLPVSRRQAWALVLASVILAVLAFSVAPVRIVSDGRQTEAHSVRKTPWEGQGGVSAKSETMDRSSGQSDNGSLGKLQGPQAQLNEKAIREVPANGWVQNGPLIARTVSLSVVVKDFDAGRASLDAVLARHNGYAASLNVSTPLGAARTLEASLRIPAPQLEAALHELKSLGRVEGESQNGEEVTAQHADLVARIKNDRETERRLQDILRTRTGKVKDVLDVEQEIARVRGEIEQMEGEQKTLEHRVAFATIDLKLAEEYKARLNAPAPSVLMQLRNASINGFRNAFESLLALVLFLAESGPSLLLWLGLVGIPAWCLWRRYRRILFRSLAGA